MLKKAEYAVRQEIGERVKVKGFIGTRNIPGASGIFYSAELSENASGKEKFTGQLNANWFKTSDLMSGKVELRPTYIDVLAKFVNKSI